MNLIDGLFACVGTLGIITIALVFVACIQILRKRW